MPARSTKAQPDEALKAELKDIKQRYSEADNRANQLQKQLGQAQKDQKAHEQLKGDHKSLQEALKARQAEVDRLNADLDSARSKGGRDAEIVAAAKQLADAVKRLG